MSSGVFSDVMKVNEDKKRNLKRIHNMVERVYWNNFFLGYNYIQYKDILYIRKEGGNSHGIFMLFRSRSDTHSIRTISMYHKFAGYGGALTYQISGDGNSYIYEIWTTGDTKYYYNGTSIWGPNAGGPYNTILDFYFNVSKDTVTFFIKSKKIVIWNHTGLFPIHNTYANMVHGWDYFIVTKLDINGSDVLEYYSI